MRPDRELPSDHCSLEENYSANHRFLIHSIHFIHFDNPLGPVGVDCLEEAFPAFDHQLLEGGLAGVSEPDHHLSVVVRCHVGIHIKQITLIESGFHAGTPNPRHE